MIMVSLLWRLRELTGSRAREPEQAAGPLIGSSKQGDPFPTNPNEV